MAARLTLDQISRDKESHKDPSSTTSLHLSHRALSDVSCLSRFRNLERLDLSFNCLTSLQDLASCVNLKWLSVVDNKLESLKGIESLSKLTVFNAGKNKLQKIDEICSVTSLRALILNDNNISSICKLDQLMYLNTLVLSKNPIYDISDSLMKARSLTKLSLSHCHLEKIGSSLLSCVELKELRLAHNRITSISTELARNIRIQNLDLGNNLIENWSDLKVLSALPTLKNLNLQGNPIAEKDKLAKKVKKLVPKLQIFNAKPTDSSRKSKKWHGEDILYPSDAGPLLHKASDVEPEEGVKWKKSMQNTFTNDEVGKEAKKKSKTGVPKKSNLNTTEEDITDVGRERVVKKAKSREFEKQNDIEIDDDEDAPFVDPFLLEKTSQYIDREKKDSKQNKVVEDTQKSFTVWLSNMKRKRWLKVLAQIFQQYFFGHQFQILDWGGHQPGTIESSFTTFRAQLWRLRPIRK